MYRLINLFEQKYNQMLTSLFGYENAVRIEDLLSITLALILGFVLGLLAIGVSIKTNMRFSDNLDKIKYATITVDGEEIIAIRKPRNTMDRIDLGITYILIGVFRIRKPLVLQRVKLFRIIILVLAFVLTLFLIVSILLSISVVKIYIEN